MVVLKKVVGEQGGSEPIPSEDIVRWELGPPYSAPDASLQGNSLVERFISGRPTVVNIS